MDDLVQRLFCQLQNNNQTMTTAESCTGGLIAAAITNAPGSSTYFERGFVTYSNQAKMDLLSVPSTVLKEHGAVSEACAAAMASGALQTAKADIAIAVTGIAGPGGGTEEKPVGLVYIGIATTDKTHVFKHIFKGDRQDVRVQTCEHALNHAISAI